MAEVMKNIFQLLEQVQMRISKSRSAIAQGGADNPDELCVHLYGPTTAPTIASLG